MSSNDTGRNVVNAFKVVYKTYENVQKLISYLQGQAIEMGKYICFSDKFLRWSSDRDIYGWAYSSFILVFQNTNDKELENGWREGSVYALEIDLHTNDYAKINITKFDYADMSSWTKGLSPSAHWVFCHPLYEERQVIDYKYDGAQYEGKIKNEGKSSQYWGLQRVVGFSVPLTDITADNAYDKIFGGFDVLAEK